MSCADVDAFVRGLPAGWQRESCNVLLAAIRALPTGLDESIKWHNPFFEYRGAVVKWYVARDWVNVYFYKGYLLQDPGGVFEPTGNSRMRTIRISETRPLDQHAFVEMLRSAVALNARAG